MTVIHSTARVNSIIGTSARRGVKVGRAMMLLTHSATQSDAADNAALVRAHVGRVIGGWTQWGCHSATVADARGAAAAAVAQRRVTRSRRGAAERERGRGGRRNSSCHGATAVSCRELFAFLGTGVAAQIVQRQGQTARGVGGVTGCGRSTQGVWMCERVAVWTGRGCLFHTGRWCHGCSFLG